MKKIYLLNALALFILLFSFSLYSSSIKGIDINSGNETVKIVVHTTGLTDYYDFKLDKKNAIVIEFPETKIDLPKNEFNDLNCATIKKISTEPAENSAKLIFYLNGDYSYITSEEGDDLVIFLDSSKDIGFNWSTGPVASRNTKITKKEDTNVTTTVKKEKTDGRNITIDLENADLGSVIRMFADWTNKNFVVGKEVSGNVTVSLRNVPWENALKMILKTLNATYVEENGIYRIVSNEQLTKENLEKEQIKKLSEANQPLELKIVPVNYADIKTLTRSLQNMLSERGKLDIDERTNSFIIKDTPAHVAKIEQMIKNLDKATPQVNIRAKVIEVSSDVSRELGIRWGAGLADTSSKANLLQAQFGPSISKELKSGSFNPTVNLDMVLSALEIEGKVKTLSTPNVTVVTNKQAKIHAGDSIPYTKRSTDGSWETSFVETGVLLQVTPYINEDNKVILEMEATVSTIKAASAGINADYTLQSKSANTKVLVDNGQTVVIGGLKTSDETEVENSLPYLNKIPILGKLLFTQTIKKNVEREIIIFVTPNIIENTMVEK